MKKNIINSTLEKLVSLQQHLQCRRERTRPTSQVTLNVVNVCVGAQMGWEFHTGTTISRVY